MPQASSKLPQSQSRIRMNSPNRRTNERTTNKIAFPAPPSSSAASPSQSASVSVSSPLTQEHLLPADNDPTPSRITDSRMSNRSRRAYYTPQTPRQFSRSAAKRDSVMALGSIAHLQHYFVKNGLASKDMPSNRRNLVLAFPGATDLQEEDEELFNQLPEPAPPPPQPAKPYFPPGRAVPNLTDLESARQEVMRQLDQVCESWGLVELTARRASSGQSNLSDDLLRGQTPNLLRPTNEDFVVSLLALTTRAVRAVQKFILTLPDPDIFATGAQGGLERRISSLEVSTSARPRISNPFSSRSSSSVDPFALFKKRLTARPSEVEAKEEHPLSVLRRTSLDVLGCLKDIELRFRIPGSATPFDQAETPPEEVHEAPVEVEPEEGTELALPAMSWEYRSDLTLADVHKEATVVKRWLEAVDGVLEGVTIMNGHRRRSLKTRKSYQDGLGVGFPRSRNPFKKILNTVRPRDVPEISVQEEDEGDETEGDEDGELPGWASETDELRRAHACLVHHLPVDHLSCLCAPSGSDGSRSAFLKSLSDGMLVCVAYNVALRESQRPWGFIPAERIHNLIELERPGTGEGGRIGLTFRRTENLRVWAAALKLRYLIKPGDEHPFEPKVIARAEEGWEAMLEWMLKSWVEALRAEKREEIIQSGK